MRKAGKLVRITVQLIEARSDTHLWSETYDRTLDDIFAIQDEIAAAVVDALQITLLGKTPKATKTAPEAYALYLQGRHFHNQLTAEGNKQAETLFKKALEIEPGFAPAWATLGAVYRNQAFIFRLLPFDEGYELARDAIQRALAIDPQYGPAYVTLHWIERDPTASRQHLQQALALNPDIAFVLRAVGWSELSLGHIDDAIDLVQRSIVLDPVFPTGHVTLGLMLYWAHCLEEAADSLQMALSLAPNPAWGQWSLGLVRLAQGDAPAALAAIEQETDYFFRLSGMAIVQHALGDAGASDAAL